MAKREYVDLNAQVAGNWELSFGGGPSEDFEGIIGEMPQPGDIIVQLGAADFDEPLDRVWERLQSGETVTIKAQPESTLRLTKGASNAQTP